ncbi:hypothetical protein UK15_07655 [Streptomyces variegatus]|uniref:DUF7426 domain-containing protein n=1 Tax=Streptomyces variegatus TaxID=284040 RepID=A0A0M2GXH4_9ACTN|nr:MULTISPECIES: hypothetical protein [Streptomyces]KJK40219.1 hypothetical protein UK15_07655 [Streptomyces variegatus]
MAGCNPFEALDDFLEEGLDLPVRGKDGEVRTYHIADPSAEAGVKIERITSYAARLAAGGTRPGAKVLDDDEEIDLYKLCLGDAYGRLMAEVSWSMFKHVSLTTMFWVTTDRDTALEYWRTRQHPGKAPRNRAERRQGRPDTSESAGASMTRSPASTSGTRAGSRRRSGRGRGRSGT